MGEQMGERIGTRWAAFAGPRLIRSGEPVEVAMAAKAVVDQDARATVLVFDDAGRVVDVDFRGSVADVAARVAPDDADAVETADDRGQSPHRDRLTPRGRGRPRLGVVAREVTLLPRHWDWLATQPGGASAAVRRLVDAARQSHAEADRLRQAKESAYRFMSAMAGDEPGFEEATRALFAGNAPRFTEMTDAWPPDVRDHARSLAAPAVGRVPA
jgi:hypothetical protein